MERRRGGHEPHARSVGWLGDRLLTAHRPVFFQSLGHRALLVRHRPTVRPIQAPGNAPSIAAYLGGATRELYRGLIKKGDSAICVGRVDGRGQRVEQLAKIPAFIAIVALRLLRLPLDSLFPLAPRKV